MTDVISYNSKTTRDLAILSQKIKKEIESLENSEEELNSRCHEISVLIEKYQAELMEKSKQLKANKTKLKANKKKFRSVQKVLDQRKKSTQKEMYVEKCRKYIEENAKLATYRVNTSSSLSQYFDTERYMLPNDGSCTDEYFETLEDDDIIAFAQLLHLCISFDKFEIDEPDIEKLYDFHIVDDGFMQDIRISEEYDCNNEQEFDCCHKKWAYTLSVSCEKVEELGDHSSKFSIDTKIDFFYNRVD